VALLAPLVGSNPVSVGDGSTVNDSELVAVTPAVRIEIRPVVAPVGTVTVMLVVVDAVTVANAPLKRTSLLTGVALKFNPDKITSAVMAPLAGVKPVMEGVPSTVKFAALVIVTPLVRTVMGPVVALNGTVVVMLVGVDDMTVASTPLNLTSLFEGVELKLVPDMVTVAVTAPLEGVKLIMVGEARTVNDAPLTTVTPLTVTDTGPDVAPEGTVVVMLVDVEVVTVASVPLNRTTLLVGVVLKFNPDMLTDAPTAPLVGSIPVMAGDGTTVKLTALVTVTPLTVTDIGPVVAPSGTMVVMLIVEELVTTA
jgi:hypothetical protein